MTKIGTSAFGILSVFEEGLICWSEMMNYLDCQMHLSSFIYLFSNKCPLWGHYHPSLVEAEFFLLGSINFNFFFLSALEFIEIFWDRLETTLRPLLLWRIKKAGKKGTLRQAAADFLEGRVNDCSTLLAIHFLNRASVWRPPSLLFSLSLPCQ